MRFGGFGFDQQFGFTGPAVATGTIGSNPAGPSYQRMLGNAIGVSETGTNQYAAGGAAFIRETVS